jgi:hypothetical protein
MFLVRSLIFRFRISKTTLRVVKHYDFKDVKPQTLNIKRLLFSAYFTP